MNVADCDRCGSKIIEEGYAHPKTVEISRHVGEGMWDHEDVRLCSMCLDDLWEWAFEDLIDRSDKADPLPLDQMAENVDRHISDLVGVLDQIEEAKE